MKKTSSNNTGRGITIIVINISIPIGKLILENTLIIKLLSFLTVSITLFKKLTLSFKFLPYLIKNITFNVRSNIYATPEKYTKVSIYIILINYFWHIICRTD